MGQTKPSIFCSAQLEPDSRIKSSPFCLAELSTPIIGKLLAKAKELAMVTIIRVEVNEPGPETTTIFSNESSKVE